MVQAYFRNSERIMAMLAEEGVSHLSFTYHNLSRQYHDGLTYVRQFYQHTGIRPKILMIGGQGAELYFSDGVIGKPIARYGTWSSKTDTFAQLEDLCEAAYDTEDKKIVLYNSAAGNSQWWTNIFRFQRDFPDIKFHMNGSSSFTLNFGGRFESADVGFVDPGRMNDQIYLPNGMTVFIDRDESAAFNLFRWEEWINMLGFSAGELLTDRDRRMRFNIRSALWASKHYADNFRFNKTDVVTQDATLLSENEYVPRSSHTIVSRRKRYSTKDAEKVLCDRCSIAPKCRVFRSGQVCGLKESEMSELTDNFKSRDAGRIIDALSTVVSMSAKRFEDAVAEEEMAGEPSSEVTRQAASLFGMGTKLAKLINPELAGPGVRVQVNVGTGNNADQVAAANPKRMMADVIRSFEDAGFKRSEITSDMVKGALEAMGRGHTAQNAIAAEAQATKDARDAERLKKAILNGNVVNGEVVEPVKVPLLPFSPNR